MVILGIETSCDETAASVLQYSRGKCMVRSNEVYSQIAVHAKTGGVVPEVAAREHCLKITPVLAAALKNAKVKPAELDAIAVTSGPGLITALMVGVEAGRTLAYRFGKPLIGVNHIAGHVSANWLTNEPIRFPALCLVVSGGHTELLLMKHRDTYQCIGRTLDDAAGEAFDKVAKLMRLGYPGGPAVSKLAEKGGSDAYTLPRPMIHSKNFDFSFAGIKTAVMYMVEGVPGKAKRRGAQPLNAADMAASFQQAVIDVLVTKTIRASREYHCKSVLLAGGVAANKQLRMQMEAAVDSTLPGTRYYQPPIEYCGDNAAMIAARGAFAFERNKKWPWQKVVADPNWELWEKEVKN